MKNVKPRSQRQLTSRISVGRAPAEKYEAWLVDLDGTLYDARGVRLAMACELLLCGPHHIQVLRHFRAEHERIRQQKSESQPSPFEIQLQRTAKNLGMELSRVRTIVETWMFRRPLKWVRAFGRPALLRQIVEFHRGGGRTGLVSDYPAVEKLRALAMTEHFDVVVANGQDDGPLRPKPWPDGLQLSAARLGVTADKCLVIGDRGDTDGLAASTANMDFMHVSEFIRTGVHRK